ncbi:MAG: tRNA (adenosine(37)-N6)-threonylcarbamoyltransferase complex transferase subunit TsaD, partial [Chloroflexi bacterium]|nr:tRNA (adenosine(37)-N6)-threonylcarbamoyltransferase complex transferase subunit TsaD [Chloroflexota bacterium]
MLILGIESSCDETAAAVVADGRHLRSSVIASQTDLH